MGGINFAWLTVWLLRLVQSQTGDMRLYSRRLDEAAAPGGGECGPCSDFALYTLAFALQLGKITEKPQLG